MLKLGVKSGMALGAWLLICGGAALAGPAEDRPVGLHEAVYRLDLDAVRRLLGRGGAVDGRAPEWGVTPLHVAADRGHLGLVRLLIKRGADVNATVQPEIPHHPAKSPGAGGLPIGRGAASAGGARGMAAPVLECLFCPDEPPGPREHKRLVLQQSHRQGLTPLHIAVLHGNREIAAYLLDRDARPDTRAGDEHTPLTSAIMRRDTELVALLLHRGAAADLKGPHHQAPLDLAVCHSSLQVLRLMAARFSEADLVKRRGADLLLRALKCDNREVLAFLAGQGAKLDPADLETRISYLFAARDGKLAAVRAYLDQGLDPNFRDERKGTETSTALNMAAMRGHLDVVRLLVERGADVNLVVDTRDNTAIVFAAAFGHLPLVKFLVQRGARVDIKDSFDGSTPLSAARDNGHPQVAAYLEQLLRTHP